MNRLSIAVGACAGLMLAAANAHAQFFDYSSVFTPNPVTTNVPGSVINVVNGSNSTGLSADGTGTDISVANFSVVSSAPDSGKASFSTPWSVALTLTPSDIAGGAIGSPLTETFAGTLTGSLSQNTALVTNSFSTPSTETFSFGNLGSYTVTLTSFTSPGAPGSTVPGALSGHVTYAGSSGITTTGTPDTPEPGALAMMFGAAVPGSMLIARRRRAARLRAN